MDVLIEVDDTVLHDSLQLLLVDTKGRLDFFEGVEEVFSHDLHLIDVVRERSEGADFDVAVEGETGRALDETADLGTRKVLRQGRELHQVDVGSHDAVLAHLGRVNGENLDTTVFVWQRDLDMDLETTGAKERLIDHVEPVRHSDQQNVVQLVHTVHLRAMDTSHESALNAGDVNLTLAARTLERSWLTTESPTPVPLFVEPRCLQIASSSSKMMMWRPDSSPFSLYCTVAEGQLSRPPPGKQTLRRTSFSASANSFRMFSSDCPTNLLRISGPLTTFGSRALSILPICRAINVLPVPGGPYRRIPARETTLRAPSSNWRSGTDGRTLDMLDAELLDESGWEDSGRESASEDGGELGVESTDTHVFKLEIRRQDRVGRRPGKRNKSGYSSLSQDAVS